MKVIAFDADDTLWHNEKIFRSAEREVADMLTLFGQPDRLLDQLYRTEVTNIEAYGFGIKGFVLSMIEVALTVSRGKVDPLILIRILNIGKRMLAEPVQLLPHVEEVLQQLKGKYRLVLATKGDLLDQQRKLEKSGLNHFFHHIEVMSDKKERDYIKLLKHLDIRPEDFTMVGNSLKSDIAPVIALGGRAFHLPYEVTWILEMIDAPIQSKNFFELTDLRQFLLHV